MKYNKSWLLEKYKNESPVDFLFFYGHEPSEDNIVTTSCFSQWWKSDFLVDGNRYPTAEHWMMAEKARLFKDDKIVGEIRSSSTPGMAKKLGRMVSDFNPLIWDDHKFNIVVGGNIHKFSQDESLKSFLLGTGNKVLVEASPRDMIWGIGLGPKNPKAENPSLWRGQNLLGFALMEVRDRLKE